MDVKSISAMTEQVAANGQANHNVWAGGRRDYLQERVMLFFSSRRRHTRYWRDWSSDVCSSDLPDAALDEVPGDAAPDAVADGEHERVEPLRAGHRVGERALDDLPVRRGHGLAHAEIGRASCGERVEISGAAVSLKKHRTILCYL